MRVEAATPADQSKEAERVEELPPTDEVQRYIAENPARVLEDYQRVFNAYAFERAYNLIFGTQLRLLTHLEDRGTTGDDYVNLVPFFREYVDMSGVENIQFADYLAFLIRFGFIETEGDGANLRVRITARGVDFLSYVRSQYEHVHVFKPL